MTSPQPSSSVEPVGMEEPVVMEEPVAMEEPVVMEEPVAKEKPTAHPQPELSRRATRRAARENCQRCRHSHREADAVAAVLPPPSACRPPQKPASSSADRRVPKLHRTNDASSGSSPDFPEHDIANATASSKLPDRRVADPPQKPDVPASGDTPHHRHTPSMDDKGHFLVYDPEAFEEPAKGSAGRLVKKMGVAAYPIFFLFPILFVSLVFAIIPLGDPIEPNIDEQWVFIFISNASVTLVFAFLYNATFLSCARAVKPFQISGIPLVTVLVVQIGLMCAVLLVNGVFDWLGLVALSIVYITLFLSMIVAYRDLRDVVVSFYARFMLLIILFLPIITGYVIAYRETGDSGTVQSFIAFAFTFIIFVYRRIMLSRLDPFPLEVSQLLSGFWVQNLGDLVAILAFPQVKNPRVYASIFLTNVLSNVFFLVFVSDPWIYRIRPALKTYVLNGLKFNFPIPPIPEPDESFDPVNRGHDANVGGYRRRQFRFFFFRMLSQTIAMASYLVISPILRYGLNKEYTPLATITGREYLHSMIYAGANLVFIAAVAVLGYVFLNKFHHQTFHEIREIHRHDLVHHTWVGLMTAIITHNMVMTIALILAHYCIYSSFIGCTFEVAGNG